METSAGEILSQIAELLEAGCDEARAVMVRDALSGSGETLERFLISNELWGGAGSIADEALISEQHRRKTLEGLLIRLGTLQSEAGKTNVRTAMWVTAFEKWRSTGLR